MTIRSNEIQFIFQDIEGTTLRILKTPHTNLKKEP